MKTLRMVLFLMALSSLCALALAGGNLAYLRASAVFTVRLQREVLALFGIPDREGATEEVFEEHFATEERGETTYWIARGSDAGTVAFTTEGAGLWSRIELLLAVAADGKSLYGMRVLSQAETPGLGGRIEEPEFQARFRGVSIRPALRVVKFASAPTDVDAITGASKTSEAVGLIINSAVRRFDRDFGRE